MSEKFNSLPHPSNGETFLKYTSEKEKSSAVLANLLRKLLNRDNLNLLDIGSGNGEYLRLSLNKIRARRLKRVSITLLEPSKDLIKRLRLIAKQFPPYAEVEINPSTFDDFVPSNSFDVILALHLPFARDVLPRIYKRMLDMLNSDGCLVVVLRKNDDIHEFRSTFKSRLMKESYHSLTIDSALDIFYELAKTRSIEVSTCSANSELHLPIAGNMRDVISIVEFFLNKRWGEYPKDIQEDILSYIERKKGILLQTDGFALVRKTQV